VPFAVQAEDNSQNTNPSYTPPLQTSITFPQLQLLSVNVDTRRQVLCREGIDARATKEITKDDHTALRKTSKTRKEEKNVAKDNTIQMFCWVW
jgi:hypothetical protein